MWLRQVLGDVFVGIVIAFVVLKILEEIFYLRFLHEKLYVFRFLYLLFYTLIFYLFKTISLFRDKKTLKKRKKLSFSHKE